MSSLALFPRCRDLAFVLYSDDIQVTGQNVQEGEGAGNSGQSAVDREDRSPIGGQAVASLIPRPSNLKELNLGPFLQAPGTSHHQAAADAFVGGSCSTHLVPTSSRILTRSELALQSQ